MLEANRVLPAAILTLPLIINCPFVTNVSETPNEPVIDVLPMILVEPDIFNEPDNCVSCWAINKSPTFNDVEALHLIQSQ